MPIPFAMAPESIERKEAVDTTVLDEKSLSATTPGNATTAAEEERAQRDAKLRPEREATFGDYIVSGSTEHAGLVDGLTNAGSRESSSMPSSGISSSWLLPFWRPRDQVSYVQVPLRRREKYTDGLSKSKTLPLMNIVFGKTPYPESEKRCKYSRTS